MYLLQAYTDPFLVLVITIPVFVLAVIIFYYLIKRAVKSGTEDLRRQLLLSNWLKFDELKKEGWTEEELAAVVEKARK